MATDCLTNYNDYRKCGEILKYSTVGAECQEKYILLCLLCRETCLQFETFARHIKQQHEQQRRSNNIDLVKRVHNSYNSGDDDSVIEITSDDDNDNVCRHSPDFEYNKNNCMSHPLDEPEVIIVPPDAGILKNTSIKQFDEVSQNTSDCNSIMEIHQAERIDNCSNRHMNTMDCSSKSESEFSWHSVNLNKGKDEEFINNDDHSDDKPNISSTILKYSSFSDDNSVITFYKSKEPMKGTKSNKAEPFIKKFMARSINVFTLISAYQQQTDLWDTNRSPKFPVRCHKRRREALLQISNHCKVKLGVTLTLDEVNRIIKYLRICYIREERLRVQTDYDRNHCQRLWFYEQMKFLKPTLNFIQELQGNQLLYKIDLSEKQIVTLIELYEKYPCLWNEEDIYYNFERNKQQALKAMQHDLNDKLKINCTLDELISKIGILHAVVKKEKELQIKYEQQNQESKKESKAYGATSYESSNGLYKYFSFLLPHLGPFKCTYCPRVISHVYTYRVHLATHDGRKAFKCPICQNEFTQKSTYVIHLRRHIQDFPFVCKFCNKGFPCKKELKLHFQNHPEYSKEYICDVCGEGFTQHKLLNWHLRLHSNTRDSICNICGKGFTNPKLLFQHRNVHMKKKSICKLCGKSYAHYRGLSRHMINDHDTTVAAVDTALGEKPKRRVININMKPLSISPKTILPTQQQ